MRVLIIGGFGFVGGRIGEYLLKAGHQIILGSREAKTLPEGLMQAKTVKVEWRSKSKIESICSNVDVIIHAAGMNAQDCAADPVAALNFNGLATEDLVKAAIRANVKKIIYISTAHVYGNPLIGRITEHTFPKNLHPYATSHLVGEKAVLEANLKGDIMGIVLRLSNAFGAPMSKDVNCWMLLINDLCKQAVESGNLSLRSNGLQLRNFIGLTEVCRIVDFFTSNDLKRENLGVFNIGSEHSKRVLDMTELIQNQCLTVLGYKPGLSYEISDTKSQNFSFKYSTERIRSLGLNINRESYVDEISELLKFCELSFKRSVL